MELINLRMAAGNGPGVFWEDADGDRYHVWIKGDGNGQPVRPYAVREARPIGAKSWRELLYRNPPIGDRSYRKTTFLNPNAKANAATVSEALRRAEAEGLWNSAGEAALAEENRKAVEREVADVALIRAALTAIDERGNLGSRAASKLLCETNDVLLILGRAIWKAR